MNNAELVAINDIGTQLLAEKEGKYVEVVGIKGTSDTHDTPETIDVTTMRDVNNISIGGRSTIPNQEMPYNYTETHFATVESFCGNPLQKWVIKLSDGSGYKFTGQGYNKINSNSVNGAQEATLTVIPTEMKVLTSAEMEALLNPAPVG